MNFDEKKADASTFSSSFLSRSDFLRLAIGGALLSATPVSAAETVDLSTKASATSKFRVKTIVEAEGSLHVNSDGDDEPKSLPMSVRGELFHDEQGFGDGALRHYWEAKADLTVNGVATSRRLRDSRQLIRVSNGSRNRPVFGSLRGPLTREELELMDFSSSGFSPETLLPGKEVGVGDEWRQADEVTRALLSVDEIRGGELTSKVLTIEAKTTKIELSGHIEAAVDGVKTAIEVTGSFHFDQENKIVKWLALSLKEKREIGFAAPGFEVVAVIRTARQSIEHSDAFPDTLLSTVSKKARTSEVVLEFQPTNEHYHMAFDRRWHVLSQHANAALLRMVDNGDLLATCRINRLTKTTPGKPVSLEGFQNDVRRALDKNCEQIISAEESVNSQDVRILRVVAAGKAADASVQGVYYHLSNDEGQRLSCVFTYEAFLASRFAGADQAVVSSVSLLALAKNEQAKARKNAVR
jgi:hypothetical protein